MVLIELVLLAAVIFSGTRGMVLPTVSNLMVVLCGDKEATPIVNTGTLH